MNDQADSTDKANITSPRRCDCPPRVSSSWLLGKRGELIIEHEGREYRLRLTQNRKLILTA